MKCEIVVDQAYPVASLFPIDDHWASPEFHENIRWTEVPAEVIEKYKVAELAYRNVQQKLLALAGFSR